MSARDEARLEKQGEIQRDGLKATHAIQRPLGYFIALDFCSGCQGGPPPESASGGMSAPA